MPETAIRAFFEPTFECLHKIAEHLRAAESPCLPVLCGTPPPKGNNERLRDVIANEPHFVNVAEQMKVSLREVELTTPRLRFKLWAVMQIMLQELARERGVPFIPVPTSVQTADGFLAEDYWSEDATHANGAYGRVMLDHLSAELNLIGNPVDHG